MKNFAIGGLVLLSTLISLASAQVITKQELTGFWSKAVSDSSNTDFISYDTLEIYYGSDGKMERRGVTHDVDLLNPDQTSSYDEQIIGTWKIVGGNLIVTEQSCTSYGSQDGTVDCTLEGDDTIPLSTMNIATVNNHKELILDVDYPDEYLNYVGATSAFTIAPPAGGVVRVLNRFDRPVGGNSLVLRTGKPFGSQLLDLRGRSVSGKISSQGFFITP